jgi:hypothetical protein
MKDLKVLLNTNQDSSLADFDAKNQLEKNKVALANLREHLEYCEPTLALHYKVVEISNMIEEIKLKGEFNRTNVNEFLSNFIRQNSSPNQLS